MGDVVSLDEHDRDWVRFFKEPGTATGAAADTRQGL